MANDCFLNSLRNQNDNQNMDYLNGLLFESRPVSAGTSVPSQIWAVSGATPTLEIISSNGTFENGGVNYGTTYIVDTSAKRQFNIVHTDDKPVVLICRDIYTKIRRVVNLSTDLDRLFLYNQNSNMVLVVVDSETNGMYMKLTKASNIPNIEKLLIGGLANAYLEEGSTNDIGKLTNLYEISIRGTEVIEGDIAELGNCKNLTLLDLMRQKIHGSLDELCSTMVSNERVSGVMQVLLAYNDVTYKVNGVDTPVPYRLYVRFGSSMTNPTEEETAQGYQITS